MGNPNVSQFATAPPPPPQSSWRHPCRISPISCVTQKMYPLRRTCAATFSVEPRSRAAQPIDILCRAPTRSKIGIRKDVWAMSTMSSYLRLGSDSGNVEETTGKRSGRPNAFTSIIAPPPTQSRWRHPCHISLTSCISQEYIHSGALASQVPPTNLRFEMRNLCIFFTASRPVPKSDSGETRGPCRPRLRIFLWNPIPGAARTQRGNAGASERPFIHHGAPANAIIIAPSLSYFPQFVRLAYLCSLGRTCAAGISVEPPFRDV